MSSSASAPRAVLFDLGGVVLGSPFPAITRYEREVGATPGSITQAIFDAGDEGAFQRLERGEFGVETFADLFREQCAPSGLVVDGGALVRAITAGMEVRAEVLEAIRRIRAQGLVAAALTNNWIDEPATTAMATHFDVFLESCRLGMRKPEPRIYELVRERLGLPADAIVYLDDIGSNLKPARAMGMHTILVREPAQALRELSEVLGFAVG